MFYFKDSFVLRGGNISRYNKKVSNTLVLFFEEYADDGENNSWIPDAHYSALFKLRLLPFSKQYIKLTLIT